MQIAGKRYRNAPEWKVIKQVAWNKYLRELEDSCKKEDKLGSRYANTDNGSNRKQVLEIG